jgi:formate hydrogenlyase subunit 3/multisubunit Na+/H+ antiporter MnhD subunit
MFFLSGCSGLVFSSDMFTYYVYYELMILCSYVLITGDEKYYAALKYMIFNSVSSMFFLAGIGLHYFSQGNLIISGDTIKDPRAILLFLLAFFIKGGFFPASSWVPTCHSGARNIFSACLSSFAISTGVLGLYRFVVIPSQEHGLLIFFEIIKYVSVITILTSSLFLFFEHNIKKAVTYSTVYVMGVCGILLGGGEKELVFIYLIIHCFYKMFMFMLLYDIDYSDKNDVLCIKTNRSGKFLFIMAVLFAGGFFPSFTYFAKMTFSQYFPGIKILWYLSMFFILGGFLKFRFIVQKGRPTQKKKLAFMTTAVSIPVIGIVLKKMLLLKVLLLKFGLLVKLGGIKGFISKTIVIILTYFNSNWFDIHEYFLIDVLILIAALTLPRWIIRIDRRRIEKLIANFAEDINLELFAILMLSAVCINIIFFWRVI